MIPAGPLVLYDALLRTNPKVRIVSGGLCVSGGGGLCLSFLVRGYVWGIALFVAVAGLYLLMGGLLDLWKAKRHARQMRDVLSREAEILAGLSDAVNHGVAPARYLNDQGIVDAELRAHFLGLLKETPGVVLPKPVFHPVSRRR